MFQLSTEIPDDHQEVEYLYDLSFAPGRAALSSYRLREGVQPIAPLCLIARDAFNVVSGAIRYWPISIGEMSTPALLLGPVAVHPTHQGEGLGGLLINESLDIAKKLDWERVILIGDAAYYCKFGFTRDLARELEFPPPTNVDRLLAKELRPNAFDDVSGLVTKYQGCAK